MKDIEVSVVEKVKRMIGISEDSKLTDLYDKLWNIRNQYHPDKFYDNDQKKKAEEKFKEIGSLLDELSILVNNEKFIKKPSDIIPYQKDIDIINIKQEILKCEKIINDLKAENETLKRNTEKIEKEVLDYQDKILIEKEQELISLYKPTKKSIISIGVTVALTSIIGILLKVEDLATIVKRYSPINESTLNIVIFTILILSILLCMRKYIEEKTIVDISKNIRTSYFLMWFIHFLELQEESDYFSELDVSRFILKIFVPKNRVIKFFKTRVIRMYTDSTLESLKDIFIYYLLSKQLIEIYDANSLERYFRIKKSYSSSINKKNKSDSFEDLMKCVLKK